MSIMLILLKSWLLGFAIAAPIGPIGLLCIRHSLKGCWQHGLAVGFGAALADSFYAFLVAGGLTVISSYLLNKMYYIKIVGGCLLLYLAVKEIKSKSIATLEASTSSTKLFVNIIFSTLLITLANPMTIISFMGIFSISIGNGFSHFDIIIIITGIFLGSMSWWIVLSTLASLSKEIISSQMFMIVKYISAIILVIFGIYAIISVLFSK